MQAPAERGVRLCGRRVFVLLVAGVVACESLRNSGWVVVVEGDLIVCVVLRAVG